MSTKYLSALKPLNQELKIRTYDITVDSLLYQPIPTVLQTTSPTTAVTCNASSGKVLTVSLSTAAGGGFSFQINNNKVFVGDVVQLTIQQYEGVHGTNGFPYIMCPSQADGIINVTVMNVHPTNALSGRLDIGFTIFSAM